jgi:diguanylate cyclase (GGDEF)-like protein
VWDSSSFTQYAEYKKRNLFFTSFDNLFGKVITTGDVIISNTPKTHPASRGAPKGHPRINRFLGLPIKIKDEVVGMIGLANKFEFYKASDAAFFQPFLDALAGLFYAVDLETARAEAEEKLRMLAMTDPLTGLLNRRAFLDECNDISQTHQQTAIAIIDIDYFKSVNDTYGHDAGDYALKEVATLARSFCSEHGFVARLGGEEFAIVLLNKSPNEVNSIFESLREAVNSTHFEYKNDRISITISIGISYTSDCFEIDFSTYLSVADQALYEAKSSGRNRTCWQPGIL